MSRRRKGDLIERMKAISAGWDEVLKVLRALVAEAEAAESARKEEES